MVEELSPSWKWLAGTLLLLLTGILSFAWHVEQQSQALYRAQTTARFEEVTRHLHAIDGHIELIRQRFLQYERATTTEQVKQLETMRERIRRLEHQLHTVPQLAPDPEDR
jgi:TolA-binding protein